MDADAEMDAAAMLTELSSTPTTPARAAGGQGKRPTKRKQSEDKSSSASASAKGTPRRAIKTTDGSTTPQRTPRGTSRRATPLSSATKRSRRRHVKLNPYSDQPKGPNIMHLFNKDINLSLITQRSSLYGVCRLWMANDPNRSPSSSTVQHPPVSGGEDMLPHEGRSTRLLLRRHERPTTTRLLGKALHSFEAAVSKQAGATSLSEWVAWARAAKSRRCARDRQRLSRIYPRTEEVISKDYSA